MKIQLKFPTSTVRKGGIFYDAMLDALVLGAKPKTEMDGHTHFEAMSELFDTYPIEQKIAMIDGGLECDQYPFFIKMSKAQLDNIVPQELPNSIKINVDETEVPVAWKDWHDSTHHFKYSNDGNEVIIAGNSFGKELSCADIKVVYDNGYAVINTLEYKQLLATDVNWKSNEE